MIGPQLTLAGRVPVPSSLAWFAVVITVVFFGPRPEAAPLSLQALPPTDRTLSVNDLNTRSLILDLLEDVAIDATGLVFNPVQSEGSLGRDISEQLIRDLRTRAIHFGTDAPAVFQRDSDLLDTPVLFALVSAQRVDVGPSSLVSLATGRNPNALELYASSVAASVPRISSSLNSPLDARAASPAALNEATSALALGASDEGSTAIAEPAILLLLGAGLAGLARQARAARRL